MLPFKAPPASQLTTDALAIWAIWGFSVLPKDTGRAGHHVANLAISGQPTLPPDPQPPINRLQLQPTIIFIISSSGEYFLDFSSV